MSACTALAIPNALPMTTRAASPRPRLDVQKRMVSPSVLDVRPAGREYDGSAELDDGADAFLPLHRVERLVHVVERDASGDEPVDVDLAGEPPIDEAGHLGTALHAAEGAAGDAAARDEEARHDVQRLALAGDAAHRRDTPRLTRRLGRLLHHSDMPGRLEGVVGPEAAGLAADPLDRVLRGYAGVGGAVVACFLEPLLG